MTARPGSPALAGRIGAPLVSLGLLLGLLLGPLLVGSLLSPAAATGQKCDSDTSVSSRARQAQAVFTGKVVSSSAKRLAGGQRGVEVTHEVEVDLVYKGGSRVTETTVEVVTNRSSGGCDLGRLQDDTTYAFFVTGDEESRLLATGDSGTAPSDAALMREVEQIFPNPSPPVAAEPPSAQFDRLAARAAHPALPGPGPRRRDGHRRRTRADPGPPPRPPLTRPECRADPARMSRSTRRKCRADPAQMSR